MLLSLWVAAANADAMTRIACLGDSIVRGDTTHEDKPSKNKLDRGNYPELLGELLGVDVRNFGTSGVTAHAGKRHYSRALAYDDAVDFAPDTAIVLLGVNDAKPTGDYAWDFDADQFVAGYVELLERFVSDVPRLERVFVLAPYRIVGVCCDVDIDIMNDIVAPTMSAVVVAAADVGAVVELIDIREGWDAATNCDDVEDECRVDGGFEVCATVHDQCKSYYDIDDGIHTTTKGSELLARLVYEHLFYAPSSAPYRWQRHTLRDLNAMVVWQTSTVIRKVLIAFEFAAPRAPS